MQRERFWFGTVMASVPVLFLLLAICPGVEVERSGPVEGHVSLHGRPLARASVFFIPEDTQHGSWALGFADDNGHFAIGSEWHREVLKGKARFRICVVPDQRVQSGEISPGLEGSGVPTMNVASGSSGHWSDFRTTPLNVQLDSGPAQVDITL
jgi:hypothetical protein